MEANDIGEISPFKNQKSRQEQNTINMEADDIFEIPPLKKPQCVILHDVIDIDGDDDSEDLVIIDEKSDYTFCQPGVENFGSVSGIESSNGHPFLLITSNGHPLVSHNLINVDGHDSDLSYDGDGGNDIFSEVYADEDEYALLQAHLDNVDIPPGTEAPFTWLPEYDLGLKKSTFKNSPWYDMQSNAKDSHVTDSSQPSWSLEPSDSKIQGSAMGCSNLQIKMDNLYHSSGTGLSSPQLFSQAAPSKKKSAVSQHRRRDLNLSLGVESSKRFLKSFCSKMKSARFCSKNHGLAANPEARKLLYAGKPPVATKFKSARKAASSSSSYHPNFKHEILRKFQSFKQFDVVNDALDHHFENFSMKQHPKNWAKEI